MINKVYLIGNVGKDPETKVFDSGNKVASFSFATNENYQKDGEWHQETQWHTIKAWGKLAEIVEEKVKKGMLLFVDGKITYRKYEKDGKDYYFTEIVARTVRRLEKQESTGSVVVEHETDGEEQMPF